MTTASDILSFPATRRSSPLGAVARALFAFLLTVAAAAALVGAFVYGFQRAHDGRVLPGVSVAGVPLGGLDRAQAEAKLRESLPALSTGTLQLRLGDATRSVPYARIGRDYDIDAMLAPAFAVGRGDGAGALIEQARSLMNGTAFGSTVRFDRDAVEREVALVAASFTRSPADASAELVGGEFAISPGREGVRVDTEAAIADAVRAIDSTQPGDATVQLRAVPIAPHITTDEVRAVVDRARAMVGEDVSLSLDGATYTISTETTRSWITMGPDGQGGYRLDLHRDPVAAEVARFAERVAVAPENAGFRFAQQEGTAIGVVPAKNGRALDVPTTTARVVAALEARAGGPGAPVPMAVLTVAPALTTDEARAVAPRITKISEWTTRYPVGANNCEGKNITIPTEILDGQVVAPGATFDFWRDIGGISREKGYCAGAAIIGGTTVEPGEIGPDGKPVEGALGGGICSCSTTLFNAAMRAGFPTGARKNHYYYISRYPIGLDATVWRSGGRIQTMEWTNDTEWPVIIRGVNGRGKVRFELYSVPTGRKVVISEPRITNEKEAQDSIVFVKHLPLGQSKRAEKPHDGFDVRVTVTVYDADGSLHHETTYTSKYGTVRGVLQVGGEGEPIVLPPGIEAQWPMPGFFPPPTTGG